MQAIRVRIRLTKAKDFLKGMTLPENLAEDECRYTSALLAVHSAISYGDALCEGLESSYTPAPNHEALVGRLEKLLNQRNYAKLQGLAQLKLLLKKKSNVAYSSNACTEEEVKAMMLSANRFSTWANTTGSDLKIQGWRDDQS